MKVIGISDLHGNLIDIPKCDILCVAGDIIPLNIQRNNEESEKWWKTKFLDWANKIDCGKIFIVPGNHDFFLEYLYKKEKEKYQEFINHIFTMSFGKVEILIDVLTEYKGIKIYGFPWIKQIEFQEGRWAFEVQQNTKYCIIPYCDILITHDSPEYNNTLNYFNYYKPRYWFYGHWHEGSSKLKEHKYNCSILNNYYNLNNKPLTIIEVNMEKTKYELLQEFAEKIKEYAATTLNNNEIYKKFCSEIDSIFTQTLENPKDKEDEIPWNESEVINDLDYKYGEGIDDEWD